VLAAGNPPVQNKDIISSIQKPSGRMAAMVWLVENFNRQEKTAARDQPQNIYEMRAIPI
jgi:hypothetical protein